MSERVLGVDTSHWSGDIDFVKMYDNGARFWITKATDANKTTGQQFEDDRFQDYCTDAFKTKLLTGCYHWLQMSVDPTVAADFYLERYNRFAFDFPPILDFEEPSVTNFSDYAWRAQVWCKRVEEKTGRKPIIYTAKWFTSKFTTSHLSWMGDYPLWVADYSWTANNIKNAPYYLPSNIWDGWDIWQFSANDRGHEFGVQAASIDLNYFLGDYSELLTFLGKDDQADEPLMTLEELVAWLKAMHDDTAKHPPLK